MVSHSGIFIYEEKSRCLLATDAENPAKCLQNRTAVKVLKIKAKHLFDLLLGFVSRGQLNGNIFVTFSQPTKFVSLGKLWQGCKRFHIF